MVSHSAGDRRETATTVLSGQRGRALARFVWLWAGGGCIAVLLGGALAFAGIHDLRSGLTLLGIGLVVWVLAQLKGLFSSQLYDWALFFAVWQVVNPLPSLMSIIPLSARSGVVLCSLGLFSLRVLARLLWGNGSTALLSEQARVLVQAAPGIRRVTSVSSGESWPNHFVLSLNVQLDAGLDPAKCSELLRLIQGRVSRSLANVQVALIDAHRRRPSRQATPPAE